MNLEKTARNLIGNANVYGAIDGHTRVLDDSSILSIPAVDVDGEEPYLSLDLGALKDINHITVWDSCRNIRGCSHRIDNNTKVFVSNTPFASTDSVSTQNQSGVSTYTIGAISSANPSFDITVNRRGRYVRVQKKASAGMSEEDDAFDDLGLAEVQIFGNNTALTNLASEGQASQSSTLSGAHVPVDPAAHQAIDGDIDGDYHKGSVTHTKAESQPYWTIDLLSVKYIHHVELFNRTDCCSNRLTNYHVFVSDTPFTGTTVAASKAQSGVSDWHNTGTAPAQSQVDIGRTGRYIRIQLEGKNTPLSLAEVKIMGAVLSSNR